MRINLARFGSGLVGNISAQSSAIAAQFCVQFISVPVLAEAWGLELYGVWLLLFTLPAYVALCPLGFSGAAANDITAAVAQGRRGDAMRTYHTVNLTIGVLGLALIGLAALIFFGPAQGILDFAPEAGGEEVSWAALLLVTYGALAMVANTLAIALRAVGAFAKWVYLNAIITVAETAVALGFVIGGGGLLAAAASYCAVRCIGLLATIFLVSRSARSVAGGGLQFSASELRRLAPSAFALAMVPAGFTLSIQGSVIVLAAAAGPAALPVFTAVRMLARTGIQLVGIVNNASMPNFTVATAQNDDERKADLVALNLTWTLTVLLPYFLAALMFGHWFIDLWTNGAIDAPFALLFLMGLSMVFGGVWLTLANLILATNRQASYSYAFVALAAISLVGAYFLAWEMEAAGAAMAMLLFDIAMLIWVAFQARKLGIIETGSIRNAPQRTLRFLRTRLPDLLHR